VIEHREDQRQCDCLGQDLQEGLTHHLDKLKHHVDHDRLHVKEMS
jgi:hypothetical protein